MPTDTPAATDTDFEREKWQADLRLRERELTLKEREQRRSQWTNPLVLAVLAAALAAIGNAAVAYINGAAQRELERTRAEVQQAIEETKAEAARILEVIKTNDPDKATRNLTFLNEVGLITTPARSTDIRNYLSKLKPGEGPTLPSSYTLEQSYTIEQHEQRLKAREQELREAFQATLGQSEERRKTIERELQGVGSQLKNLKPSYEERLAELKRLAGELEALRGEIPDAKLQEALDALRQGRTGLADARFAEIESKIQQSIELTAKATFERGLIAYQEVRWQEARSNLEKADRLVPDHDKYSVWAARLAYELGDYGTAAQRFEAILDRVRKGKGEDAPETAPALNNLAGLYRAQGRYGEAEQLLKKAIAIDEKALPADHLDLATGYNNLAEVYRAQNRYGEAEQLLKKAIAISEKALPADHPDLTTGYNSLAGLYRAQDRYGEAEQLLKKAIVISEKALPADHPDLAIRYNNLAEVYRAQNRYGEAKDLYKKALKILETKLGPNHPYTSTVARSLATFLESQGQSDEVNALQKGTIPETR